MTGIKPGILQATGDALTTEPAQGWHLFFLKNLLPSSERGCWVSARANTLGFRGPHGQKDSLRQTGRCWGPGGVWGCPGRSARSAWGADTMQAVSGHQRLCRSPQSHMDSAGPGNEGLTGDLSMSKSPPEEPASGRHRSVELLRTSAACAPCQLPGKLGGSLGVKLAFPSCSGKAERQAAGY